MAKKLLEVETSGGLVNKTWLHVGDNNQDQITVQTFQDVEPIMKQTKHRAQQNKGKDFRYKADIPSNLINEACYQASKSWGVSAKEAMEELMIAKTDRAKKLWKVLTEGRDFRKFQAKNY